MISLTRKGSKAQAKIPSLKHQSPKSTQKTTSRKKQQGCRDRWLEMQEPFQGPTHRFSFAATYPGLWQRKRQSGLVMPENRMGIEASGRERMERVDARILKLRPPPDGSSIVLRQTTPL